MTLLQELVDKVINIYDKLVEILTEVSAILADMIGEGTFLTFATELFAEIAALGEALLDGIAVATASIIAEIGTALAALLTSLGSISSKIDLLLSIPAKLDTIINRIETTNVRLDSLISLSNDIFQRVRAIDNNVLNIWTLQLGIKSSVDSINVKLAQISITCDNILAAVNDLNVDFSDQTSLLIQIRDSLFIVRDNSAIIVNQNGNIIIKLSTIDATTATINGNTLGILLESERIRIATVSTTVGKMSLQDALVPQNNTITPINVLQMQLFTLLSQNNSPLNSAFRVIVIP